MSEDRKENFRTNSKRYYERHREDLLARKKEKRANETPEEKEARLQKRREYYSENAERIRKQEAERKQRKAGTAPVQKKKLRSGQKKSDLSPKNNPEARELFELIDAEE